MLGFNWEEIRNVTLVYTNIVSRKIRIAVSEVSDEHKNWPPCKVQTQS